MTPSPVPATPDDRAGLPAEGLLARLRFDLRQGRIWLDQQRMLLVHASALGVLHQDLIETLGLDAARGLITRLGYNSGSNDAELAHRLRGSSRPADAILLGTQLHMLEGVARVEPVRFDIDEERGHFHGEFHWHGSAEAEAHMRVYGQGTETVCWQQVGYASGFSSRFMGRPVMFREVRCRAQGAPHCVIVGKPVDEWVGAEEDLRSLQADRLSRGPSAFRRSAPAQAAPAALPAPPAAATAAQSLLGDADVVGVSAGFNAVCHMVRRAARTQATVLFLGESGAGKEVLARSLHRISPRARGPFVAINCAAIPEGLVESELFGVEKGGFTGAVGSRAGRFERAEGGTLFLDEIGTLSGPAQGKLLRALQEREVERVGGVRAIKVDVRVVAATNLDLREAVARGSFREDLFFRLNVLPVRVPPLRERREDIPVFMNHFLHKFNQRDQRRVTGFTGRAIDALLAYRWPGNIRELENLVERGVALAADDSAIDVGHLFLGGEEFGVERFRLDVGVKVDGGWGFGADAAVQGGGLRQADGDAAGGETTGGGAAQRAAGQALPAPLGQRVAALLAGAEGAAAAPLDEVEAALIRSAMLRTGGNQSAAARLLGLTRAQLIYRLKALRRAAAG